MSEPKKKEAPASLVRAADAGAPVRALRPVRRVALPLAVAAALVLGSGAGTAAALGGGRERGARVEAQGQAFDPVAVEAPLPRRAPTMVATPAPSVMPTPPPVVRTPVVLPEREIPKMAGVAPRRHAPLNPKNPGLTL